MITPSAEHGLRRMLRGKSADVDNALAWYKVAKGADWQDFESVRNNYPDADFVDGKLVFNIRHNRFRLIVLPVFARGKLYVKALLTHREYVQEKRKRQ